MEQIRLVATDEHLHLDLGRPCPVLGSCVLGGGLGVARHVLNLRVDANLAGDSLRFPVPETTLREYCSVQGWEGAALGMMTAASMKSIRTARLEEDGLAVLAAVTAGLTNARRAGDPAECRDMPTAAPPPGTINIIVVLGASLPPAALVEAVITITEAKAAVLQDMGVTSRTTGLPATGTGTDAVAVAALGGREAAYCGKHVLAGELTARAVMQALAASLEWYATNGPRWEGPWA
ncbi:MAG: adenosylcobinamide amidohydrolase [Desulfovibrio sp.]|jgi:adenosylcobinamide amidohydrolase|nr:adenosylcobinamide amidohydrolase [Desulfovibrio sp.]